MISLPTGPAPPLPAPNIGVLLARRARATPEGEFLRFEERSLTFAEAAVKSARVAGVLAGLRIQQGDRVAVMLPNGLEYPILWLGIVRRGAVLVPCNTGYQARDLAFVLENSGARVVITNRAHYPAVEAVRGSCPWLARTLVVDDGADTPAGAEPLGPLLDRAEPIWDDGVFGPADLATLQYTSGTTGFPKGCMLPHEYWLRLAMMVRDGSAHTGDLMVRDHRGYYRLVGRLKDMIRRGGENIAAAEVEAVLAEHPAVRAAACVPVPDEVRGEEVKAVIELQPGWPVGPELAAELAGFCRARLAPFKAPRYVAFVDSFPLTPSQRVEKHRLDHTAAGYDLAPPRAS